MNGNETKVILIVSFVLSDVKCKQLSECINHDFTIRVLVG